MTKAGTVEAPLCDVLYAKCRCGCGAAVVLQVNDERTTRKELGRFYRECVGLEIAKCHVSQVHSGEIAFGCRNERTVPTPKQEAMQL